MDFEGAKDFTLDTNGRFAVPTLHREVLLQNNSEGKVVLTLHPTRCIWMMTPDVWAQKREALKALKPADAGSAAIKLMMLGNADPQTMDSSGRILISPGLRRLIPIDTSIKQTLWLVGVEDHLAIWTDTDWKQQSALAFSYRSEQQAPPGFESIW